MSGGIGEKWSAEARGTDSSGSVISGIKGHGREISSISRWLSSRTHINDGKQNGLEKITLSKQVLKFSCVEHHYNCRHLVQSEEMVTESLTNSHFNISKICI